MNFPHNGLKNDQNCFHRHATTQIKKNSIQEISTIVINPQLVNYLDVCFVESRQDTISDKSYGYSRYRRCHIYIYNIKRQTFCMHE